MPSRAGAAWFAAQIVERHAVEMTEPSEPYEERAGVEIVLKIPHPKGAGVLKEWEVFIFFIQAVDVELVAGGDHLIPDQWLARGTTFGRTDTDMDFGAFRGFVGAAQEALDVRLDFGFAACEFAEVGHVDLDGGFWPFGIGDVQQAKGIVFERRGAVLEYRLFQFRRIGDFVEIRKRSVIRRRAGAKA